MSVKNYKIYKVIGKCSELLDSIELGNGGKEIIISECGPTIEIKAKFNSLKNDIQNINMTFYETFIQISINKLIPFNYIITANGIDIHKSINTTAVVGFMYEELNSIDNIKSVIKSFLELYGVTFNTDSKNAENFI